jgi:hypothetical protein
MNSSSSLASTSFFALDTRFFEAGNGAGSFVTADCFGDDPFGGGVNALHTRGTLPYIYK